MALKINLLGNTKGTIKNRQCRDTAVYIGLKTQKEDKQNKKHNTEN
jgi:hypothetical protein